MNKVKNCYDCPAHTTTNCLLGYTRDRQFINVAGPKGLGHIEIYSPKSCCHKPRTQKEFIKRLKEQ